MLKTILWSIIFIIWASWQAYAGSYIDSAHGNTSYGVKRISTPQYDQGHCAHCHEQHASIEGVEPDPIGGPDNYLLFNPNQTSQTINFCFDCHVQAGGYQDNNILTNKSYSYNFGGNTSVGSYDNDIKEAFSHTTSGSSHNLSDIVSQVLGKVMYDANGNPWSLPSTINPCDACHNPHIVQRNYPVSIVDTKLKTAVTRPSDPNNLWGDDSSERMSYYLDYQSPYWYGANATNPKFEPAGDLTEDGSNLPDFVRLCTDCHNEYNTIYSSNLGRNVFKICWLSTGSVVEPDAHGAYDGQISWPRDPYLVSTPQTLSCTDCHEPHGSSNIFLLRTSINGVDISVPDTSDASWQKFCYSACHTRAQHRYDKAGCFNCHYHGSSRGGF